MTRKILDVPQIASAEITPEAVWLNRRNLMKAAAAGTLTATLPASAAADPSTLKPLAYTEGQCDACSAEEPLTPVEDATSYNNFYEFGTDKSDPAEYAHNMTIDPWAVQVSGLSISQEN